MTEKNLTLFVNYRRDDEPMFVYSIYVHFYHRYGADNIFWDLGTIPLFEDFQRFIQDYIRKSDVVVPIIGPRWLELLKAKQANGQVDFVKFEIEEAIHHNKIIAPILIKGASLPKKEDVPESLHPIWQANIPELKTPQDIFHHIQRIMTGIEGQVKKGGKQFYIQNNETVQAQAQLPQTPDLADALDNLARAKEAGDYAQALIWISVVRNIAYVSPELLPDLDEDEKKMQDALRLQHEMKLRRDTCENDYKVVRYLLRTGASVDKVAPIVKRALGIGGNYLPDDLKTHPTIIQIKPKIALPDPFDWCYIPEGDVKLTTDAYDADIYIKKDTILNVPAFWMAKYPVTNAQFAEFIKAGGYQTDKWWTKAGIAQRNSDKWTQPRYWDDKRWNGAEYPVVGVSWYEAVAYCNWLSEKTGEKIMLPNDAQWQRAAQGDDGREYPWGNGWNGDLCNNSVKPHDSNNTTPVQKYEGKGNSPFDVVDMAGNVWEWCLTTYKTGSNDMDGTDVRVLRGGSWYGSDSTWFRVSFRNWYNPHYRNDDLGYRFCSLL